VSVYSAQALNLSTEIIASLNSRSTSNLVECVTGKQFLHQKVNAQGHCDTNSKVKFNDVQVITGLMSVIHFFGH